MIIAVVALAEDKECQDIKYLTSILELPYEFQVNTKCFIEILDLVNRLWEKETNRYNAIDVVSVYDRKGIEELYRDGKPDYTKYNE